jgi:CO/xanthine dehydrogenase Mo-binding subunit
MAQLIGQSIRRREDRPLLLGQGQYASDVRLPGMLHLAVVRSVYPHGRLDAVSLEALRGLEGVWAFTAEDLPEIRGPLADAAPPGAVAHPRPVLASGKVRYVGEPIAAVVAEDPVRAVDAAQLVEVEVTPLDGVGRRHRGDGRRRAAAA